MNLGEKYVSDLSGLFQTQGTQLYSGQHSLCLTTVCLHHLQRKFSSLEDESGGGVVSNNFADTQHLYDSLCKIQSLKLISDRKNTIAPSLINLDLSLFKALQSLVVKRVPISSLAGLQRIREQLNVLTIQRCNISDIEDVLVKCGRDNSRAYVWSNLKQLDLSVNSIKTLGDSLRYLPSVEQVNLGNNQIGLSGLDTESSSNSGSINSVEREDGLATVSGIKFIDTVRWLHLGFNQLACVPQFGDRARFNLTVLILRNNLLRDIQGVEVLDALVELDLSENLISKHSNLRPLLNLHNLNILVLSGNPVSFDPKHRIQTVQCLSHVVPPTTFQLDGKKLSAAERKAIPRTLTHYSSQTSQSPQNTPSPLHGATLAAGTVPDGPLSSTISTSLSPTRAYTHPILMNGKVENDKQNEISKPAGSLKRGRGSVKKSRVITFDDEDESPNGLLRPDAISKSTSSTSIPFLNEKRMTKDQDLRNQLKTSWLISTNSSGDGVTSNERVKPLPKKSTKVKSKSSTSKEPIETLGSDLPISNGFHSEVLSTVKQSHSPEYSVIKTHSQDNSSGTESQTTGIRTSPLTSTPYSQNDGTSRSVNSPKQYDVDFTDQSSRSLGATPTLRDSPSNIKSIWEMANTKNQKNVQRRRSTQEETEKDEEKVERDEKNGMFNMEPGIISPEQSKGVDPIVTGDVFQVSLFESDTEDDSSTDSRVLISLSDRFFQELTFNGDVQDQLDLQCLKSAQVKERVGKETANHVLVLHFTYERRDRRKREYLLTDSNDKKQIMDRLEPILEQNASLVSIATKLECLKCQVVIDWSEAIDAPGGSPVAMTSKSLQSPSSYDANTWSSLGKLCPHCKESFLIQMNIEGSYPHRRSFPLNDSPKLIKKTHDSEVSLGFDLKNQSKNQSQFGVNSSQSDSRTTSGILSPGHIDLSVWDTYPDSRQQSNSYHSNNTEIRTDSPIPSQPSPVPDMGPFHVLMNSELEKRRRGKGVVPGNIGEIAQKLKNVERNSPELPLDREIDKMEESSDVEMKVENLGERGYEFAPKYDHHGDVDSNAAAANDNIHYSRPLKLEETSVITEDNEFGTKSEISRLPFEHYSQNPSKHPFDDMLPSKNPFDDPITSKNPFDDNYRSGTDDGNSSSKNPFDDPLYNGLKTSGSESDSQMFQPQSDSHVFQTHSDSTKPQSDTTTSKKTESKKSLSLSNVPGPKEREPVPAKKSSNPIIKLTSSDSDSTHSKPKLIPRKSPPSSLNVRLDDSPVSASVPSESGFMSYFFRSKSKEGDTRKGEQSKGHSRSRSQDFDKVPPLPESVIYRSIDRKTKTVPESPTKKIISQLALSSSDVLSNKKNEKREVSDNQRGSSGEDKKSTSSGSSNGKFGMLSMTRKKRVNKKLSSSETEDGKHVASTLTLYKNNDPTYIHNSIDLHLNMNVFSSDKKEEFQLALRAPVIQYGDWNETEAFLIVSNRTAYLYRVTAPESLEPDQWLELKTTLKLRELVFIEVGVGYQSLRLEFDNPPRCYTFQIGNEDNCRKFFDKLSYIVSDVSRSSFRSVRISQFSLSHLSNPHGALKEVIFRHYDKLHPDLNSKPLREDTIGEESDMSPEQLQMYVLAYKYNLGGDPAQVSVTLVLTNEHLFLGLENPQWPLPKLHPLPDRSDLLPPYSGVIRKDITDVEQLILYDDQQYQFTLQFFKESTFNDEPVSSWTIIFKSSKTLQKFIRNLKTSWAERFQQTLPTEFR